VEQSTCVKKINLNIEWKYKSNTMGSERSIVSVEVELNQPLWEKTKTNKPEENII
jgi:hypothetical protein